MGERQTVGFDGSRFALLVPFVLLALALVPVLQASAQEAATTCAPGIGRIIAFQGNVEIQRAGQQQWVSVKKLNTALCPDDRLRTDAQSRAVVSLQPETFVRVDQNTVIRLKQATDDIEVEFFGAELAESVRNAQPRGAGYFITRFPKKFKVTTPHMNAAVEGTEFMVQITPDATKLTVLEGKVSSQSRATGNTQLVAAGQSIASSAAGVSTIETVVKPEDAVQWVLRYPPISDQSDPSEFSRAEQLLRAGSVEEALAAIDAKLAANPSSSDAHALRAVIQIAKNDKSGALESAKKAIGFGANNYRAWLALSYAQQAAFDLEGALQSTLRAASLQPNSVLADARVAELYLSLGDNRRAEEAARAAVAANPGESHPHSILGFVHLSRTDPQAARSAFEAAIERDSFSSLPRLGLGLAMIREGDLVAGREQLEIAVALDPSNSLLRSYVGKAYYEENTNERNVLAASQFALASQLDPSDPTPRLYDAIRLQTSNQPVAALQEIRHSVALNDNRAIYRSELRLDEDLAVRSASQGRIYTDLGFEQLAILDGWKSVNTEPGDFSGHRLLADNYSRQPRFEVARVNELFTSQLLQPQNLTPVPPQLGERNLFILDVAGPTDVAFNEFNRLFASDGQAIHFSANIGGNDTWGDDLAIAAVEGRWSISLGQFHFESDGFRVNNDLDQDLYNIFAQYQHAENTSFVAEVRVTRRQQGDIRLLFDPESFDPTIRQGEDSDSVRLGVHNVLSPRSELLASLVYQDAEFTTELPSLLDVAGDVKSTIGEVQHIYRGDLLRFVSGIRQSHREQFQQQNLLGDVSARDFEFDSTSVYAYSYWKLGGSLNAIAGVSADFVEGRSVDTDQVNPKLGIWWEPSPGTVLRVAAVRTIQPDTFSRQDIPPRLEPTQVAGVNQVYSGAQGESEWHYEFGFDRELSDELRFGVELSHRDLDIPFVTLGPPDVVTEANAKEYSGRIYFYWTPLRALAASAFYQYDKRENEDEAVFPEGVKELRTHRLPISLRYFNNSGFSAGVTTTYVDQQGEFLEFLPGPPFIEFAGDGDRFWVADATLTYRLPRRKGIVELSVGNLLDEDFKFQDIDPENPTILPDRLVSMRFTLAF